MKIVAGVVIAVVLLLLLTPLGGWIGVLVYGGIAWTGQLFANAELSDDRLAFRAGVLLGGSVSTLSLLRVAWQDRSANYLSAALMFGLGMSVLVFVTSSPPARSARTAGTASLMDIERQGGGAGNRWISRTSYERDAAERVELIARTAARGDLRRADTLLEELKLWPRRRPRSQDRGLEYQHLWDEYRATFDSTTSGKPVPAEVGEKRRELLQRLWEASPSNSGVGIHLLLNEMTSLHFRTWRHGGDDISPDQAEELERDLHDIHALQQTLFAYEPAMPELWNTYAATIIDSDEELALGALVVAERLKSADSGLSGYDTQRMLLRSDLRVITSLLTQHSGRRLEIIEARAGRLNAGRGSEPAAGEDAGNSVSEQVMPPAGKLVMGKGLAISPLAGPPSPPSAPSFGAWGEAQVDLPAAGFRGGSPGIVVQRPGVTSPTHVVLVLDVWKDGQITSVLVERSSGDDMLDQAARQGARWWKNKAKLPPSGERRRVTVTFRPSPPAAPGGMLVTEGEKAMLLLGNLLQERALRNPVRFPSGVTTRDGFQGLVLLSVTLSADGNVRGVSVARSSGQVALDEAAREAAWKWNVQPPDGAVKGIDQVTLTVPVRFQVEQ